MYTKIIKVIFYETDAGNKPVREWLSSLCLDDKKIIGEDMKTVEYGWPVGMPVCKSIGNELYEVRSNLTDGKIARVIFVIEQGYMILLHGFIKKTQKIPKKDLELAKKRKGKIK